MIIKRHIFLLLLLGISLMLTGCSHPALHEAREVIAVADSLRAEGQAYTDSVTIAEAYNTLYSWRYFYPTDYVHACYHYGRPLRATYVYKILKQ